MSEDAAHDERILVLAPTGRDAALSCDVLKQGGLIAVPCPDVRALCAAVPEGAGALLVTEEALDPAAVRLLVEALDAQPQWSDLPVVLLTGGAFAESSLRPLRILGPLRNVMLLERPVRVLVLVRAIMVALRARRRQYEMRAFLSERAALWERDRQLRQQAEDANRIKDDFLATLSHELRTPLNAVLGWTRMIARGQVPDPKIPHALETIERNAESQLQLVNGLLDASGIVTGRLRLRLMRIDLAQVIQAAVDAIQPSADAKELRVEVAIDPDPADITGDVNRLQQVMWNLLANAVKFTPNGGAITVRLQRAGDCVQVVVSDTGRGIEPDFLPYVFDRFRQEDSSTTRAVGGLGLGLAIVRHLVEAHGGEVAVESAGENSGATFRLTFPIREAGADVAAGGDVERVPVASDRRASLHGRCALVMGDSPATAERITAMLQPFQMRVHAARDADEALGLVRSIHPDVAIVDVEAAEEGALLVGRLRRLPLEEGGRTPVLAIIAGPEPLEPPRAMSAGFDAYVPKPFDAPQLVTALERLLEEKRPRVETRQ